MKQMVSTLGVSLVLVMGASCDQNDEAAGVAGDNDAVVKSDKIHEPAPKVEPEDMDALRADQPVMALAKYEGIRFAPDSSTLDETAQEKLDSLADEIESDVNVYLTVRVKDENGIEATPPDAELSAMANPRMQSIKSYLEEQGVNIVKVGVDSAQEVGNYGEDNALVRPDEQTEGNQIVIIDMLQD